MIETSVSSALQHTRARRHDETEHEVSQLTFPSAAILSPWTREFACTMNPPLSILSKARSRHSVISTSGFASSSIGAAEDVIFAHMSVEDCLSFFPEGGGRGWVHNLVWDLDTRRAKMREKFNSSVYFYTKGTYM